MAPTTTPTDPGTMEPTGYPELDAIARRLDRVRELDARALDASVRAEQAAKDSLMTVRRNVELGSVGYLALLNAQQTYQQAVLNLAQAQANRYADTAALFQALGGGWWNRDTPAS